MSDNRTLEEKFEALANGEEVKFTPEEIEQLGAFEETAITPEEVEKSHYPGGVFTSINETLEPPRYYTK
ncbi:MAG: hypothetical protein JXR47_05865 [Thiotrichales bacterium]|nr:hypothetical protein [Thiotrichales bacterium]